MNIIDFTPAHIDDVLNILHESNCLHYQNNPEYFTSHDKYISKPYLQWILDNPDTFGLVAVVNQAVAGMVLVGQEERKENVFTAQKYWQIYDIAVSSQFKKMGIGRKLHQEVVSRAEKKGISQIELEVYSFNQGAKEFYKKLHYHEVSSIMALKVKSKK